MDFITIYNKKNNLIQHKQYKLTQTNKIKRNQQKSQTYQNYNLVILTKVKWALYKNINVLTNLVKIGWEMWTQKTY